MKLTELKEFMSVKVPIQVLKGYQKESLGVHVLKGKFAILSKDRMVFVGFLGDTLEPKIFNVVFVNEESNIFHSGTMLNSTVNLNAKQIERTRFPQNIGDTLESVAKKINKNYRIEKNIEIEKNKVSEYKKSIENTLDRIGKQNKDVIDFDSLNLLSRANFITKRLANRYTNNGNGNNFKVFTEKDSVSIELSIRMSLYDFSFDNTKYITSYDINDYTEVYTKLRSPKSITTETYKFLKENSDNSEVVKLENVLKNIKKEYNPNLEIESYSGGNGYFKIKFSLKDSEVKEDFLKNFFENTKDLKDIDLED